MISNPICPPKPPPAVPIADGADHEPSASRAIMIPDPNRAEPRKPALNWVITARPWRSRQHTMLILDISLVPHAFALLRIWGGMTLSGPKACRGSTKDARIFAACIHSPAIDQLDLDEVVSGYVLLIDEGRGLLIPNGILPL